MEFLNTSFFIGLSIGLLLVLFRLALQSYFKVEEGFVAVVSRFGRAIFEDIEIHKLKSYHSGLHFKWPWDQLSYVSIMEQNIDLAGELGGKLAMADDGTTLRLDSKLRFSPIVDELYQYMFVLKSPQEHIKGLFTCLLRNEIANFRPKALNEDRKLLENEEVSELSKTSLLEATLYNSGGSYAYIRRERHLLNKEIEEFCRNQIGKRYGVRFDAVDLTDIFPPEELGEALNAIINAQTEAETLLARVEAECEQKIMAAKQNVEISKNNASAVAQEILKLGEFLSDLDQKKVLQDYLKRRRSEVFSESKTLYFKY